MSGKVKVDLVDPNILTDEVRLPVLRAATKIVAKRARATAPRGHGPAVGKNGQARKRLYQTIRASVTQKGKRAAVATKAPHGWIVHHGTQPHIIGPKKGHALVIAGHIIGRKVRHPGAKGQPYLSDAAEQSRSDVAAAIRDIV